MYSEGSRNILSQNQQLLKITSFSSNTVADIANDLAEVTQCQLKEMCKHWAYSLATSESADVTGIAQLLANLSELSI